MIHAIQLFDGRNQVPKNIIIDLFVIHFDIVFDSVSDILEILDPVLNLLTEAHKITIMKV